MTTSDSTEQTPSAVPVTMPIADGDQRVAVLNGIYTVMTTIASEIRGTVERLTMTGCGVVLAFTAWVVTQESLSGLSSRVYATLIVLAFVGIAMRVLTTLNLRYRGVAQVIRNINDVQLAHVEGAYVKGRPLFPPNWKSFGSEKWREPIFGVAYISWTIVAILSISGVWVIDGTKTEPAPMRTEQSHALEPATESVSNGRSSPPAQ